MSEFLDWGFLHVEEQAGEAGEKNMKQKYIQPFIEFKTLSSFLKLFSAADGTMGVCPTILCM